MARVGGVVGEEQEKVHRSAAFRAGPTFPALFLGAALGAAFAPPALPPIAGMAMGIGAMSAVMLRLPLTSVLLATLLLARTAWCSCRS